MRNLRTKSLKHEKNTQEPDTGGISFEFCSLALLFSHDFYKLSIVTRLDPKENHALQLQALPRVALHTSSSVESNRNSIQLVVVAFEI